MVVFYRQDQFQLRVQAVEKFMTSIVLLFNHKVSLYTSFKLNLTPQALGDLINLRSLNRHQSKER